MIEWIKRRGKEKDKYNDEETAIYASTAPSSR
jgi:hypothetical protein